nr:YqaJ viral recombinase family protein [uncultured Anaerostipes sp.]
MRILVKTAGMSREEWLRWRTKGIGGSDVSVIAGVNPFRSIFQLWLEKTGQIEPEETENENTHFGNVLEPVVKREFSKRTGLKVRAKRALLQSEEYPFMLADLDGVIYENGKMNLFEAKTASAYKQEIWEKGIPEEYVLQVQHYMAVTGAEKTYLAALVGGNRFYWKVVRRDEQKIAEIIALEKAFWEENVLAGKEPVPDGSGATTDFLNEKYASSNGNTILLPEEALGLCRRYEELSGQLNELQDKKDAVSNQLKNFLKNNESGVIGEYRVTWKQVTSMTFDKKRLEKENHALYEEYLTKKQYRRLTVA